LSYPVAGVAVTFAVASGGGSVSPRSPVTTNASGIAAVTSWTRGTRGGLNTLTATATGLAGSPVTFTATGTAGGASSMALNAGDGQTERVGYGEGTALAVILLDQFDTPVAVVAVTIAVASGGGTVSTASPVTAH